MRKMSSLIAGVIAVGVTLPALAQESGKMAPLEPKAEAKPSVSLPPPVAGEFIREQMERSARILSMQRQGAELDEIGKLIESVGVDTASRLVPGASDLADSTIGISARIEEMRQINELSKQIADGKKIMNEINGVVTGEDGKTDQAAAQGVDVVRNDGKASGVMNGPVDLGGETPITRDELEKRLASLEKAPKEARSDVSAAPVVTEIYGSEGDMTAIIRAGSQDLKVKIGDDVMGDNILEIRRDAVVLDSASGENVLKLR